MQGNKRKQHEWNMQRTTREMKENLVHEYTRKEHEPT